MVDVLAEAGVRRIYGVVSDSLNGITNSIRVKNNLEWVHVRHEEVAAFAAGAEAHLTGTLAVCAGSCGRARSVRTRDQNRNQTAQGDLKRSSPCTAESKA